MDLKISKCELTDIGQAIEHCRPLVVAMQSPGRRGPMVVPHAVQSVPCRLPQLFQCAQFLCKMRWEVKSQKKSEKKTYRPSSEPGSVCIIEGGRVDAVKPDD